MYIVQGLCTLCRDCVHGAGIAYIVYIVYIAPQPITNNLNDAVSLSSIVVKHGGQTCYKMIT